MHGEPVAELDVWGEFDCFDKVARADERLCKLQKVVPRCALPEVLLRAEGLELLPLLVLVPVLIFSRGRLLALRTHFRFAREELARERERELKTEDVPEKK